MVPAKDPARLVVASDGTTTVVGEPAAAVAPPVAAAPPGLGGGVTAPAPEAPSTTSFAAAPQAVLAAAVAAVKPVAKEAEAAEAATQAAEGDGPDATGGTSSDADSTVELLGGHRLRRHRAYRRRRRPTARPPHLAGRRPVRRRHATDSATGTSRAAARSGDDTTDSATGTSRAAAARRRHRHRGHDRGCLRGRPHRRREQRHARHLGARHPDDNGHRLMPAAPPRTRPAGAARSSPSAPRPGARGGRPATRTPDPRRRLRVGQIVLVVALVVATVKLVVVQGPQAGTLQAGSARQRTSEIALPAERGRDPRPRGRAAGVQRRGPRARHQPPADRHDQGRRHRRLRHGDGRDDRAGDRRRRDRPAHGAGERQGLRRARPAGRPGRRPDAARQVSRRSRRRSASRGSTRAGRSPRTSSASRRGTPRTASSPG